MEKKTIKITSKKIDSVMEKLYKHYQTSIHISTDKWIYDHHPEDGVLTKWSVYVANDKVLLHFNSWTELETWVNQTINPKNEEIELTEEIEMKDEENGY